jgi:Flp pilus assembly protein TadG
LEFAIVLPIFFLLVFGILDFGRLFYVEMTLQNAVRQAGRYASTGNHAANPADPGTPLTRAASILQAAQQAAPTLNISSITINSLGGGPGSAGGPGDTVTISITTSLQLITPLIARLFPGGIYTFAVSSTFKNEPFPPSETK